MNKKPVFLIFCMIFVACAAQAQQLHPKEALFLPYPRLAIYLQQRVLVNPLKIALLVPQPFLPPSFYITQIGFFCQKEIKFEKVSKIPFKFRLGGVEDCDRLEGKGRIR